MAKRKPNSRAPQPKHRGKSKGSQFDRVNRLSHINPNRVRTGSALVPLVGSFVLMVAQLTKYLDKRISFRMPIVVSGMLLSSGRRTASSWFRMGGVRDDWDRFYEFLIHLGQRCQLLSWSLLMIVVRYMKLNEQATIRIAIDDSPTKRYGKYVEGAGVHRNPTAGPADGEWIYGHSWVTVALTQVHAACGVIALPIRSMLYVRQKDVPELEAKYDWKFKTKHQLAIELVTWFVQSIRDRLISGAVIQLVIDGAYVSSELFEVVTSQGVTIISRLRKDAKLFSVPKTSSNPKRGRPRKYGQQVLSLAKRAASRGGWSKIVYRVRQQMVTRQYKSFLETSRITRGTIRVVIVRYEDGSWAPYISTDTELNVREILEAVADRWSIEESFHDLKEVWGGGQQQVRNIWSSIGCWNLIGWVHTLVHMHSWDQPSQAIADRSDRTWDNPDRRPSLSDRIRLITKEMLAEELNSVLSPGADKPKIQRRVKELFLYFAA